jgi:hypothetical protein
MVNSIPLTVDWSPSPPHDMILAGCHDGTVYFPLERESKSLMLHLMFLVAIMLYLMFQVALMLYLMFQVALWNFSIHLPTQGNRYLPFQSLSMTDIWKTRLATFPFLL